MPFNRALYPKDWNQIRARILERDGNKCKFCGVPNGVHRHNEEILYTELSFDNDRADEIMATTGRYPAKIVLTIAHLEDPDPMNCADENLAALCQRCHNRLDVPMRQSNARKTRARRAGQAFLLEGEC